MHKPKQKTDFLRPIRLLLCIPSVENEEATPYQSAYHINTVKHFCIPVLQSTPLYEILRPWCCTLKLKQYYLGVSSGIQATVRFFVFPSFGDFGCVHNTILDATLLTANAFRALRYLIIWGFCLFVNYSFKIVSSLKEMYFSNLTAHILLALICVQLYLIISWFLPFPRVLLFTKVIYCVRYLF